MNPFSALFSRFQKKLYVSIQTDHFSATNIRTGKKLQRRANPPFSAPHALIGNFTAAVACLKPVIKEMIDGSLALQTTLILHPLEKTDGDLTEVERCALKELGLAAGATKVILHMGRTLSDREIAEKFAAP